MKKDNKTETAKAVNKGRHGYKHTPLGWLPETWEYTRLDKLSDIVRGSSPRPAGDAKFFNGDYIPWLTVASLTTLSDSILEVTQTEGSLTELGSRQSRILEKGTLILSNSGATLGVPKILGIKCCANDGIAAFINWKDNVADKKFILYYLANLTKYLREVIAPGNGQPNLNTELIGSSFVPLPPINEQNLIVKYLSIWDEAINKTQQLIEQLKRRNKGLMRELLTGRKRLQGFESEWNKLHIHDIANEVSLKNGNGKNLTVLSCTKYDGLVPSLEYFGRQVFGNDTSSYKVVPQYHFAYATNHIEEGSIGYQKKYEEALISPMYTVFKTTNLIHDEYLFKLLKSHQYINEYCKRMEGSIDRRGGLRWDSFSKISIHLPKLEEQKALASVFRIMDEELILLEKNLAKLNQQKKGLMQKLLTGEILVILTKNT